MSRRKGEITARVNERDFPHIVALPLPAGGFRSPTPRTPTSSVTSSAVRGLHRPHVAAGRAGDRGAGAFDPC